MENWFSWVYGLFQPAHPADALQKRSSRWSSLRAAHLKTEPVCQVCGRQDNLDVHHVKPVHVFPQLELEPSNLLTLCEPHHLLFGHLVNWKSWNPLVRVDCVIWRAKISGRP